MFNSNPCGFKKKIKINLYKLKEQPNTQVTLILLDVKIVQAWANTAHYDGPYNR